MDGWMDGHMFYHLLLYKIQLVVRDTLTFGPPRCIFHTIN